MTECSSLMGDILEARFPTDLNVWDKVAVLGLHSHTAEQDCDETCSVYYRSAGQA